MSKQTEFRLTAEDTGASSIHALNESPDFSVLVNRLITKRFGAAAARNRQTIFERDESFASGGFGRDWTGVINGRTYNISEVGEYDPNAQQKTGEEP